MKISNEVMQYLLGEKFDNVFNLQLENNEPIDRLATIADYAKDKVVLHIGCCDHLPLIKEKVENKTWLQGRLEASAKQCVGIDINDKAIDYVNEKKYSQNVYYCDIMNASDIKKIPNVKFECIVLGEILEHVDNPVEFLQVLHRNLQMTGYLLDGCMMIITVPNLMRFQIAELCIPVERINTDHRYWFSPYTIMKVMVRAGIIPDELLFADLYYYDINNENNSGIIEKIKNILFSKQQINPIQLKLDNSYKANNIIAIGHFQQGVK